MITNEVQYRGTKAHLSQFEKAISNLAQLEIPPDGRKLHDLQLAALRSQADDLRAELNEYEELQSGAVTTFEASSLRDLADILIKARISKGWSQRRLAEELNVAEQQIQRYESTRYASTSLARLCDIAAALEVSVREVVTLGKNAA
ncbi:MAG: helix-turn-helix domain-containing protein [Acidimicrobiales bacterium]